MTRGRNRSFRARPSIPTHPRNRRRPTPRYQSWRALFSEPCAVLCSDRMRAGPSGLSCDRRTVVRRGSFFRRKVLTGFDWCDDPDHDGADVHAPRTSPARQQPPRPARPRRAEPQARSTRSGCGSTPTTKSPPEYSRVITLSAPTSSRRAHPGERSPVDLFRYHLSPTPGGRGRYGHAHRDNPPLSVGGRSRPHRVDPRIQRHSVGHLTSSLLHGTAPLPFCAARRSSARMVGVEQEAI